MEQPFVYRPYKSHLYMVPFTLVLSVATLVLAVIFFRQNLLVSGTMILSCAATLTAAAYLCRTVNIAVHFDSDGLRFYGGAQQEPPFLPWETLRYAYHAKNYKGFRFLLLSPEVLTPDQIKAGVRAGENGRCLYGDRIVVLHLFSAQEISTIEKRIADQKTEIIC